MKKILASFIVLCLIETSVFGQGFSPSIPSAIPAGQTSFQEIKTLLNYSNLASFKDTGSPFPFIIIQDLHCHAGVQKNINMLLSLLNDNYKVQNVFVEGASGNVDLSWLYAIKDKSFADKAAQSLLDAGKLTGAEYFAYEKNMRGVLKGIEEKDIHLRNLQRLAVIVESKKEIEPVLSEMRKDLMLAQRENYGTLNKKLGKLHNRYRNGKIDSVNYYKKLIRYAESLKNKTSIISGHSVNINDYQEILEYVNIAGQRENINIKVVSSQLSLVISDLKNTVTYNQYNRIVQKTNSFRDSEALFYELEALEEQGLINLGRYKELAAFIKNSNSSKYLNPVQLLEAEQKLLKSLQLNASLSEKEVLIVVLSEIFENYNDYYTANLSSDGYVYLKSFGIRKFQEYFSEAVSPDNINRLDGFYDLFGDYYETNLNRDMIFAKFIDELVPAKDFSKKELSSGTGYSAILEQSEKINIVVCGGFHSEGLIKEFDKRGASYVVITPKIDGDVKKAGTVYEDILLESFNPKTQAIALQVLSQTGQQRQFTEIIETMLSQELEANPKLDIAEFLNATVNAVCAIDAETLAANGVDDFIKPINNGIKVNQDGSFEIEISFEGKTVNEKILINRSDNKNLASILGFRHYRSAALWEWVYMLPFSSIIMQSKVFKAIIKTVFARDMSFKSLKKAITFNKSLKKTDIIFSMLFSSVLIASFFIALPLYVVLPVVALYAIVKGFVFAVAHNNSFAPKNNKDFRDKSLITTGILFSIPTMIMVTLFMYGFVSLPAALAVGVVLNIFFHEKYNNSTILNISKKRQDSFFYRTEDLISYFYRFAGKIETEYSNPKQNIKKRDLILLNMAFKLFRLNRNANFADDGTKILIELNHLIKHRKQSGYLVNSINRTISSQLKYLNQDTKDRILRSESETSFDYLYIMSQLKDPVFLRKIVSDVTLNLNKRLYAYMLLRATGHDVDITVKSALRLKANHMISNFSWKYDLADTFYNDGWVHNEKLQSYITAVYITMTSDFSWYAGNEDSDIFKMISNGRFDAKYNNADSSLSFGMALFSRESFQKYFPEIVAHELAHIRLLKMGFLPIGSFRKKNLQRASVHELYADIAGYLLANKTGRNAHGFFYHMSERSENVNTKKKIKESHLLPRTQFYHFVNMLGSRAYGGGIDFDRFSFYLQRNVRRNVKNSKVSFKEIFLDTASSYLSERGIEDIVYPENMRDIRVLDEGELRAIFRASVFGDDYEMQAPFWEWVYMFPGISFIAESKVFSKILSRTILKNESDAEKNIELEKLQSNKYVKMLDIAGIAALGIILLTGGLAAPALLGAYLFTRSIIFASAHKGFNWKAHWKEKLALSGLFAVFSLPVFSFLALGFTLPSFILFAAAGIPFHMAVHYLYNNVLQDLLPKKIKNFFPKASLLNSKLNFDDYFGSLTDSSFSSAEIATKMRDFRSYTDSFRTFYQVEIDGKLISSFVKLYNALTSNKIYSNDASEEIIFSLSQKAEDGLLDNLFSDYNSETRNLIYSVIDSLDKNFAVLHKIVNNAKYSAETRIYAYIILKSAYQKEYFGGTDFNEAVGRYVIDFDGSKICEAMQNETLNNKDIVLYSGAAYAFMAEKYPELIKFDDEKEIYKDILKAVIQKNSKVFDATLTMGDGVLSDPRLSKNLLQHIIHELAHKYLLSIDVNILSYGEIDADLLTMHEFYAEAAALMFSYALGKENSYMADFEADLEYIENKTAYHSAARNQLLDLYKLNIDIELFAEKLKKNIKLHAFLESAPFSTFIFNILFDMGIIDAKYAREFEGSEPAGFGFLKDKVKIIPKIDMRSPLIKGILEKIAHDLAVSPKKINLKNFDGRGLSVLVEGVDPSYRMASENLKETLCRRLNIPSEQTLIYVSDGMSLSAIMSRNKTITPFSCSELSDSGETTYLFKVDKALLDLLSSDNALNEEIIKFIENSYSETGNMNITSFDDILQYTVKSRIFRSSFKVPSIEYMQDIAAIMLKSNYDFSEVNSNILEAIMEMDFSLYAGNENIIKYQVFEFLGFVFQSQAWLSPGSWNANYGYLQKEEMFAHYERSLADTPIFDAGFGGMFKKHNVSQVIKSKEAALHEYIKEEAMNGSSFLMPSSIFGSFKNFDITGNKNQGYDYTGIEDFTGILKGEHTKEKFEKYLILNCVEIDDINAVVEKIKEHNKKASSANKIKKVLFYNAQIGDYPVSMQTLDFETSFIFDLPSLANAEESSVISQMFTKVPAVLVGNSEISMDYGSRLDNFSLHYLHILLSEIRSFTIKKDDPDYENRERIGVMPDGITVAEHIKRYEKLISDLKKLDIFDSVEKVFFDIALYSAEDNIQILREQKSSAPELNSAIDDYRTLLNYFFYFKWMDIESLRFGLDESELNEPASAYESMMRVPVDSSGRKMSQNTVLVTSGMSAVTVLSALFTSEGIDKLAFGQNTYYENAEMFQMLAGITTKESFLESMFFEVLRLQKQGFGAIFIDIVSNSVTLKGTNASDIETGDIKKIVKELAQREFIQPFYLCIDNSLYPSFQFADILDGIDLPDNFNIVIHGSMQKLHQRGLEINTAGSITLISNGFKHGANMSKIKEASKYTSSDIDNFRHITLKEFLSGDNSFMEYASVLNRNAEEFAGALNQISVLLGEKLKIIHPSLYTGRQKEIWENNNQPGIPVLFIRDKESKTSLVLSSFEFLLKKNMKKEGFHDYLQRDSYGFNSLSYVTYGSEVLRFNIGDLPRGQKDKLMRAFTNTFIEYIFRISDGIKITDGMYSYIKQYGDIELSAEIKNAVSENINFDQLQKEHLLKIFIVFSRLNIEIPENITSRVKMIMDLRGSLVATDTEFAALMLEAFAYLPEVTRKEVLEVSGNQWLSGSPETKAAAALNLTAALMPAKSFAPDTETISPAMRPGAVSGILSAA